MELENGAKAWAFWFSRYVSESVKNVEKHLERKGRKLPTKAETPIQTVYRPELDVSPELNPTDAAYYQSLIGILRWIVEMGRIDIGFEVGVMSSHTSLPRIGHLHKVFHIFGYLKHHDNARLVFDPTYPDINYDAFPEND